MKALLLGTLLLALGYLITLSVTRTPENNQPQHEATVLVKGEQLYNKNCLACHQEDGSGVPGMYPPLRNNPHVTGKQDTVIKVILKGQKGPLMVNGQYYNAEMAAYNHLSNEEIAAVATYIRQNFGNEAGPITAGEVQQLRDTIGG
ncbi:MAG: cytochrome c [Bacteroidales bacterium]|nr:cytochrome c [Bacteroidales bacterium]